MRGERMRRVRPWALVLGGLLCACACARVCAGAGSYPHSAVLDGAGAYRLRWGRRGSALALRLEVRTRGYVGFGLSASGGMASADIVVGGVERGQPYLQVRTCSFPSTATRVLFVRPPSPRCPSLGTPLLSLPHVSSAALLPCIPAPLYFFLLPFELSLFFYVSFPWRRDFFSIRSLPTFPPNFYMNFVKVSCQISFLFIQKM